MGMYTTEPRLGISSGLGCWRGKAVAKIKDRKLWWSGTEHIYRMSFSKSVTLYCYFQSTYRDVPGLKIYDYLYDRSKRH